MSTLLQHGQLMTLGSFIFQISTAAFDKLVRHDKWRWVTLERLMNTPAEQFVGYGSTTIVLSGNIYPFFIPGGKAEKDAYGRLSNIVGDQQIDSLRIIANTRQPQTLTDGRGNVWGKFVIINIEEEREALLDDGTPRKQAFKVSLRSFGNDGNVSPTNNLRNISAGVTSSSLTTGVSSGTDAALSTVTSALQGAANAYANGIGQLLAGNGISVNDAIKAAMASSAANDQTGGQLNGPAGTTNPPAPPVRQGSPQGDTWIQDQFKYSM